MSNKPLEKDVEAAYMSNQLLLKGFMKPLPGPTGM